jgi:hypothetical protein
MAAGENAIGPREPAPKTIGLCMIVKDEAKVILRCLASVSRYNAGKPQQALGAPIEIVVATLQCAADLIPAPAEALHAASRACRIAGRHQLGYDIARRGLDLCEPAAGLFIEPWIYRYGLLDEYSINAYRAGHRREALEACGRLLGGDAAAADVHPSQPAPHTERPHPCPTIPSSSNPKARTSSNPWHLRSSRPDTSIWACFASIAASPFR